VHLVGFIIKKFAPDLEQQRPLGPIDIYLAYSECLV